MKYFLLTVVFVLALACSAWASGSASVTADVEIASWNTVDWDLEDLSITPDPGWDGDWLVEVDSNIDVTSNGGAWTCTYTCPGFGVDEDGSLGLKVSVPGFDDGYLDDGDTWTTPANLDSDGVVLTGLYPMYPSGECEGVMTITIADS